MARTPRDDYYVLMWHFKTPLLDSGPDLARLAIRRFRELACNCGVYRASFAAPQSYHETLKIFQLGPGDPKLTEPEQMEHEPLLESRFPFYVMNMVRPLYWNWNDAKPLFKEQYRAFETDRDRSVFVRTPCVNNPAVDGAIHSHLDKIVEGLAPVRDLTLLYDIRDEPSITSFLLASDSCFCEHCMDRMRTWLRERYGDLGTLNNAWDTQFGDWSEVVPQTTQEALDRRAAGQYNFAPWADHRAFMNATFARVVREVTEHVHRLDDQALVGLTGTQCPSVFGGYDMSNIVHTTDWVEAYDFGCSVDFYRSFKPRRHFPILKTSGLGGGPVVGSIMLWSYVFQSGGYGGTIIWNSNSMIDIEDPELPFKEGCQPLVDLWTELRSGIPRLLQLTDEVSSPVAVHYSHASVNADYITSTPPDWQSLAGYETERFAAYQTRRAWWHLLEDRGLRPTFISTPQIEAGELATRGVKVLVLPRSIAVSDAEAAEMRKFVEAGGILVADSFAGRMDGNCRELDHGQLDDLFGITRGQFDAYARSSQRASFDWQAEPAQRPKWGRGKDRLELQGIELHVQPDDDVTVAGCSEMTDAPIGIVATRGKGKAIFLNASPLEYLTARRLGGGVPVRQRFFGHALDLAGVEPEVEVLESQTGQRVPGWRVWRFNHGRASYFGVSPDPQTTQDTLGAITTQTPDAGARTVRIRLAASGHIYEGRTGRHLGQGDSFEDTLGPSSVRLYCVLPYEVAEVELSLADGVAGAAIKTIDGQSPGEHLFRFDLYDADGRRLLDSGANVVAAGGRANWQLPADAPAGGRLVCRDVASGAGAETTLA